MTCPDCCSYCGNHIMIKELCFEDCENNKYCFDCKERIDYLIQELEQ